MPPRNKFQIHSMQPQSMNSETGAQKTQPFVTSSTEKNTASKINSATSTLSSAHVARELSGNSIDLGNLVLIVTCPVSACFCLSVWCFALTFALMCGASGAKSRSTKAQHRQSNPAIACRDSDAAGQSKHEHKQGKQRKARQGKQDQERQTNKESKQCTTKQCKAIKSREKPASKRASKKASKQKPRPLAFAKARAKQSNNHNPCITAKDHRQKQGCVE